MSKNKIITVIIFTAIISLSLGFLSHLVIIGKQFSMNQPKRSLIDIKKEIYRGNAEAYSELRTIYLDNSQEEFLFWALYMANRYHDKDAYSDVYRIMQSSYSGNLDTFSLQNMDTLTKAMTIQYLDSAARNGDEKAIAILKMIK